MEENAIGMPDSFFERLNKKNGFADDTTAAPVDSGTTPVATDKTIPSGMPDSFFEKLNSQQHYADTNNWAENYKRYIPQAEENPSAWDNIKNNFFAIKDASEASMYGGLELMSRQGEKSGNANFANFIKAAGMYYGADPNWLVKNMQENEAQSQEELKRVWLDPKMGQFNATDMFADPKSFFQTQLPQMLGGSATLMAAGMGIAKGVQTGVMALGAAGAPFTFGGSAVAAGFIGGAVASAISRPIESLMEGYGAFDEAYSELAKKYPNATHQQLTDMAMPVFNKTFDENMQLQVLDAVQLGLSIIPVTAWGKGSLSGTGAIGRMARRADMMRQRYNVAAHIGETAFQMGTEGWEEGRQMQITNEAINKYVGTDKPTSWYDMLNTKEGQSAVSGGAFMGGMMESPGILKLAYNKLTGVGDDIKTKPYEDIKQKQTALFYGNIAKSVNEGTTNEMMQAINKFGRSGVLATVETDDADSRNKSSIAEAKRLGDEVAEQVGVFSRMKEQYPDVSEKGLVRMFQNNALIRNNANALKTLSEDNVTDAPIIQRINAQNEALNKENNDIIAGKDVWETPSHEDPFADPEKDKEADIPFDSVEEVEAARLKEIEALQQIPTDGMTDEQMHQRAESLAEINSRYEDLKNRLTEKINDAKGHYENQRVLTEMLQNNIPVEGTIQKAYGMHYDFVTQDGKTVRFYNQATHDVVDDNDFNGSAFLVLRKAEQGLDGTYKDEKGNYLFRSVLGDKDHAERIEVHTTDKDGNDKYLGNVAVSNAEDYNIARDRAKAARMEKLEGEDGEGEGFSVSDEQLSGVKTTSNEQAAEAQSYGFRNAYHALNSVNKYFDADYTDYANIPKEDLALVGRIKQEEAASATTTTPPPDSPPPSEPDTPPAPPTPPPTPPPAPKSPSPANAPSGTTSSTDSGNAGYERTERSFDKVNVGDNITHNGKQGKVFAKVRPKGSLSHPVVLAKDAEGVVFRVSESEYKGTERGESDNVLKTNGKLLSYRNDIGRIVVDEENNVIFEGNKSSVELGKTTDEEFAAKSIGDIGISYVNENSLDQAILVDNTVYIKGEQQELVRINYDKNDNVVSYTYKNSKGHERTNRNSETALDIAIQKNNQEFDKSRKGVSDEVKQRDEEHISGVVKSEYGDSIGYILETMPDEVYDTFDLMESGVTSLEKDAIQYMVLRTIEALADARKRIEGSNATKKEKGSALSMIEKFEKDLNKYYGKLDQQSKVSAKNTAEASTRENNKGDGTVQTAEQKTEAYHADKAAGKETELVKAAEDLLAPKVAPTTNTEGETQTTEAQLQEFGVPEQDVKPVTNVLTAMVDGLRKAGLTAAKTVGEWLQIGKGEEKPYTLKINGEEKTVKPVNAEVVNGFYSPLEKVITESKQDKMPAKQWLDKFAKGEEAKWTGLQEWLSQQQGSVSKADIQKFLKENRIQVVEVVKGEVSNFTEDDIADVKINQHGAGNWVVKTKKDGTVEFPLDKADDKAEAIEYALEQLNYDNKSKRESKPKFQQYQIEGEKENYKEVLVTLPNDTKGYYALRKEFSDYSANKVPRKSGEDIVAYQDRYKKELENDKDYQALRQRMIDADKKQKEDFKSSHFDEPNILVHLRMSDRIDSEGNKVLHLSEIQSDWGQKGKKEGFNIPAKKNEFRKEKQSDGSWVVKDANNTAWWHGSTEERADAVINEYNTRETRIPKEVGAIPNAPFVTDTNQWVKLGLKTALKYAVKSGATKITWETGETQNARYDLSKQVDEISTKKYPDGTYTIIGYKDGNSVLEHNDVPENKLEEYVGKDLAKKISDKHNEEVSFRKGAIKEFQDFQNELQDSYGKAEVRTLESYLRHPNNENSAESKKYFTLMTEAKKEYEGVNKNDVWNSFSGVDLKVGGKGMKGFYGSPTEGSLGIVGNVAKSLFKQEPKTIELQTTSTGIASQDKVLRLRDWVQKNKNDDYSYNDAQKDIESNSKLYQEYQKNIPTQHSITITPEMKAEVEGKGQPLFKDAEAQYRIESGKNIIEAIKDFNQSKNKARATVALTHEIMHPTVVSIIDGAKEGNEVGARHTKTIVDEYNKANPDNKVTEEELIADNDKFVNGETTDKYRAVQEFIAEQWERYHQEGAKGFSKAFQEVLDAISEAFKSVYNSLVGKELTPELRKMFDEILGKQQPTESTPNVEDWSKDVESTAKALNKTIEFKAEHPKYFEYVPLNEIEKYKEHDRAVEKKWGTSDNTLNELVEDIKKNGIKTPITLQIDRDGRALIVEGNTRLAAAKKLGIKNIPVRIISGEFGSINKDKTKKLGRKRDIGEMSVFYPYVNILNQENSPAKFGFTSITNTKNISEAYHKAKADGSNPELVKAVEDLLGKAPTQYTEAATPKDDSAIQSGGEQKLPDQKEVPIEQKQEVSDDKLSRLPKNQPKSTWQQEQDAIDSDAALTNEQKQEKKVEVTAKALEGVDTFHLVENEGEWKATTKTYIGREIGNWAISNLDKKQQKEYLKIRDEADTYGTKEQAEENLKKLKDFEQKNKEAFERAKQEIDALKEAEERKAEERKKQQKIFDQTEQELNKLSDKEFDKLVELIDEKRRQALEQRFGDRVEKRTLFRTPISESYHKAKADGSNPELVKAVEDLINKNKSNRNTTKEVSPKAGVSSNSNEGNSALRAVESTAKALEGVASNKFILGEQESEPTAINVDYGDITWQQSGISAFNKGSDGKTYITDKKGDIYQISKTKLSANNTFFVTVKNIKGDEIGSFEFKKNKDGSFSAEEAYTSKKGKGVAAIAYDFASQDGNVIKPSKKLKKDGVRFWAKSISQAYHADKAAGKETELVKAVEELLDKPKETSPTPNSKGEGTEVKYQIEESRDEPLASVNPALAEHIRQRMQRLFPSVALFSDKASFEAAAKKVSKGVTFSSAYIGAAIKNLIYVDAEKALQHTEIHEYAHIYWDALPADHPLKTALLDKFGGNEEAAIDAIGRAGTIIMENELDIAKSGFFEKWLKKFWAAVKGVFTSKSIEQAFAERLLTNADEVTEENITSGVVKYMKMKSSAKYSELSEKAVKGIEKIIGKKISSLTFPEYYKHISTEIKPNDFKQWKMLSPQKFLEKMYGIVSPVSTLSPSNKAVFMKQYREYLDDYNWAENNVWTRFASGSMTLTVKEIEDLYMEAYKRKSYGTKDAVNFLADLYSKAVMYKNMQQEIKGDTFNKPFAKMSFDMMSGHEITDLSGSEFVSGKYSLLSPDRVKETILQGREKLYREVQRNATIKEDALKNDFDAIWKKVKDLKSDLRKIVDKTGTYFIDRNSSAYKALRGGTAADRALADLLDMHYKYESAYGGLSMEKGKYRVPVARMDFGGLAKKFGFKEGMRRYFAKPSKYDNVIIDVRSLGLSKPLMTLKQARQEMVKGSNAIYPFQMLKLTKKVDALTKEAYKQFNSGRHANGDIVTTEDLSGSRYGVSFVKDDESSEDLKVSMMLYHYANIENESYDLLSPYSMYIQKYLGRKDKPNMLKWVKMLDDDLIKGESPTSNLGVYAKYVQALTNYTHWLQLGFNIAGMPFNAFAGFAQSVREIGFRNTLRGLRRVIGSLTVGGGAGVVNAKAISIMEKLHIVSLSKDLEMSVTSKIGKGISKIAFLPVSFVEYINHAYSFIGAMDESEWERVKALPANASAEDYTKAMGGNERVDELHTLTQKINGAYSKYSRRGINKTAEGRALMQFKNWLPDVIFAHLTVSQLNEAGEDLYGEYQSGIATSVKNTVWNKTIIPMFKDKSIAQAKKNWETLSEHEQMQVGKAMRQLVILGGMALWIASLDDRDDKELKRMLRRAMGDVTYIFDVSNMQFLFDNTVPVFGTIKNLLGLVAEVFSTATGNPSVYEKRQGSHMRGDLKLPVMIENQTPVVNKISKLVNEKD